MKNYQFGRGSGSARRQRWAAFPGRIVVAGRHRAGTLARTGLAGIALGLVLAAGTAAGASGSIAQAAFVAPPGQAVTETAPAAPTGLVAGTGDGQVTLSWAAPASGGGATSYNVYAGTSQDFRASTLRMTVRGLGATVSSLANGTRYYFWVTAANGAGTSSSSNLASATPASATAPGPPAGLTASGGHGQVTLSWSAPAPGGMSPVTGYDIYVGTTQAFRGGTPAYKLTGPGTRFVVTNLGDGTTYYFKVAAVSARGAGPVSAVVSATTVAQVKPVLGAPDQLEARPGRTRVVLLWLAPASTGSTKISGYLIYEGTRPGGESGTPVTQSLVHYTATAVTGLASNTRYYFKVAAVDTAGHRGALSAEASAVPWPAVTTGPGSGAGPGATASPGATAGQGQGRQPSLVPATPAVNLTQDPSSPRVPAGLIILLAAVAVAAMAGAFAIVVHLRRMRLRRPEWAAGAHETAALDDRTPDMVSDRRYR